MLSELQARSEVRTLVDEVGSRLHEQWRTDYAAKNGAEAPRWKAAKDAAWEAAKTQELGLTPGKEVGAVRMTDDGKVEIDIAHTDYSNLTAAWQGENKAAGQDGVNVLNQAIASGLDLAVLSGAVRDAVSQLNTGRVLDAGFGQQSAEHAFVLEAGDAIHNAWLGRNGSWAPAEQQLPYLQLDANNQKLDLNILQITLEEHARSEVRAAVSQVDLGGRVESRTEQLAGYLPAPKLGVQYAAAGLTVSGLRDEIAKLEKQVGARVGAYDTTKYPDKNLQAYIDDAVKRQIPVTVVVQAALGLPESYVPTPKTIANDFRVTTPLEAIAANGRLQGLVGSESGREVKAMVDGNGLRGFIGTQTTPRQLIKLSALGFTPEERTGLVIESPWGDTQTVREGQEDAYIVREPKGDGTYQYYMVQMDANGDPENYIVARSEVRINIPTDLKEKSGLEATRRYQATNKAGAQTNANWTKAVFPTEAEKAALISGATWVAPTKVDKKKRGVTEIVQGREYIGRDANGVIYMDLFTVPFEVKTPNLKDMDAVGLQDAIDVIVELSNAGEDLAEVGAAVKTGLKKLQSGQALDAQTDAEVIEIGTKLHELWSAHAIANAGDGKVDDYTQGLIDKPFSALEGWLQELDINFVDIVLDELARSEVRDIVDEFRDAQYDREIFSLDIFQGRRVDTVEQRALDAAVRALSDLGETPGQVTAQNLFFALTEAVNRLGETETNPVKVLQIITGLAMEKRISRDEFQHFVGETGEGLPHLFGNWVIREVVYAADTTAVRERLINVAARSEARAENWRRAINSAIFSARNRVISERAAIFDQLGLDTPSDERNFIATARTSTWSQRVRDLEDGLAEFDDLESQVAEIKDKLLSENPPLSRDDWFESRFAIENDPAVKALRDKQYDIIVRLSLQNQLRSEVRNVIRAEGGETIEAFARRLIGEQARQGKEVVGIFNGVELPVKGGESVAGISQQYREGLERNRRDWEASPEGQAARREQEAQRAEAARKLAEAKAKYAQVKDTLTGLENRTEATVKLFNEDWGWISAWLEKIKGTLTENFEKNPSATNVHEIENVDANMNFLFGRTGTEGRLEIDDQEVAAAIQEAFWADLEKVFEGLQRSQALSTQGKPVMIENRYKASLINRDNQQVLVMDDSNYYGNLNNFFAVMLKGLATGDVSYVEGTFNGTTIAVKTRGESYQEFETRFFAESERRHKEWEASSEGQAARREQEAQRLAEQQERAALKAKHSAFYSQTREAMDQHGEKWDDYVETWIEKLQGTVRGVLAENPQLESVRDSQMVVGNAEFLIGTETQPGRLEIGALDARKAILEALLNDLDIFLQKVKEQGASYSQMRDAMERHGEKWDSYVADWIEKIKGTVRSALAENPQLKSVRDSQTVVRNAEFLTGTATRGGRLEFAEGQDVINEALLNDLDVYLNTIRSEMRNLARSAAEVFVNYVRGKVNIADSQLEQFSVAVYTGANTNIDEFLNNFIRSIENEAGVDAAQYVQDIIATMRGIAQFVSENYKNGGAFAVSPGDLSDEEQAAYYGKAAAEASALIEKLYYHGTLGPNAQKALKEAGVENLQSVKSLNAVSTIAFWHNFIPVLLPKTDRLEGNFRSTLLQIGIDYSNYEVNDLSQFEIALAAFVQFVVGYAAINELDASEVQILNRRQAGEKIDEKTLQGIQGKLLSKLNQIPGISNVITGFMNGTPNILVSQIQNFVTQYRSEQRIKVAA